MGGCSSSSLSLSGFSDDDRLLLGDEGSDRISLCFILSLFLGSLVCLFQPDSRNNNQLVNALDLDRCRQRALVLHASLPLVFCRNWAHGNRHPARDSRPAYANYEQPRMGDNDIRANTERAVNKKAGDDAEGVHLSSPAGQADTDVILLRPPPPFALHARTSTLVPRTSKSGSVVPGPWI
ncbi:hypothetical protein D9619_013701 [Psilocybe cf. subviscida]|uniref:Uncharacterized protein n=1 Tax=Psilocybe cf. subviscida TaxID=2480587 RepID=A0A8H5AZB2_9AGAR|nr:hypothetical protein D9619_013701 [Psilocybe cf. subviscida]